MNNEIRKSKIYSYFHGAGNVFQQFIIAAGILCILMGPVAGMARDAQTKNAYEKYSELNTEAEELKTAYKKLYNDYSKSERYNFTCEIYEEAEIAENDKNSKEKTAYNQALKAYNDAEEKVEEAKENLPSKALYKTADDLKDACESVYYRNYYKFDFKLFETATIEVNDRYLTEKTAYNEALKAYNDAKAQADSAAEAEKTDSTYTALIANAEKLKGEYEKLHKEYSGNPAYNFICTEFEEAEIADNDRYAEEKKAHNEALKDYNKVTEKTEKAYKKLISLRESESAAQVLFPIIGILAIVTGVIWSVVKKFSFDRKSCEEAYDEEIQIKVEEAKSKALEKLNIVAEQIEKVEPVVLNGIATPPSSDKNPVGKISALFQNLFYFFSSIKVILLGAVAAAVYCAVSMIFGSVFFIPALGAIALIGFFGFKVYSKYEKDSYIDPKTIKNLENVDPALLIRLGTDDNIRVSLPAITVYMFGDEQVYMYYQYFDICTGKIFCEGIHEYFYEDIVGVVSAQETKKMFKRTGFLKLFREPIDYLKESITVVSSGCKHSESYIVPVGSSLLDTSFVGMRNLIRQKKADND